MLHKKENTNTTAVVEYAITDDDLTHPALYRFKRNSLPCYSHQSKSSLAPSLPPPQAAVAKSDWDLYPSIMREMKNH